MLLTFSWFFFWFPPDFFRAKCFSWDSNLRPLLNQVTLQNQTKAFFAWEIEVQFGFLLLSHKMRKVDSRGFSWVLVDGGSEWRLPILGYKGAKLGTAHIHNVRSDPPLLQRSSCVHGRALQ